MKLKIKLTLTEEMLGTKAANADVFADYIASKHPKGTAAKDELDRAEHREEAGTTIFHRDDDVPGIYDYQIRGFLKSAAQAVNRFDKEYRDGMEKLPAAKSKIDQAIFVYPRFIKLMIPDGGSIGVCERSLRAETAQGPRVSLCRSETVPAGTTMEFEVHIMSTELRRWVQIWFDHGKRNGLGQWRNSSKGRFDWAEVD